MTRDESDIEFEKLAQRVRDLEQDVAKLDSLPQEVAALAGALGTLTELVKSRFDGIQKPIEDAAGIKVAVQYAAVVIVPIIVAIIGGYFVLKGAQVPSK